MNQLVPLLSSGMLTFVTFLVIAAFILLGSMSLKRHVKRASSPWESDLTAAGREAQKLEHPGM